MPTLVDLDKHQAEVGAEGHERRDVVDHDQSAGPDMVDHGAKDDDDEIGDEGEGDELVDAHNGFTQGGQLGSP